MINNGPDRKLGVFRLETGEGRSGSQGSVYRAVCEGDFPGVAVGETVALKAMPAEDDPELYARFKKKIAKLTALESSHVVRYRGCFSAVGPFQALNVAVMDWLDGCTLKDILERERGGIDVDEALRIADGILKGLAEVHAAGIVHRDLKPGNVFLGRDGSVKLIDFEVSHRAAGASQSSTGGFAGTFDYMAPEFADTAFRGSPASDVFSAGVVLHEMLSGQLPYARKPEKGEQADFAFLSRWSQRKEGLCAIRVKSSVKRILSHADEVLLKALAENPADRYPDAAAFRDGLRRIHYREVRSALDAYRLLRLVGEGGFGCVYKARSHATGRFVAVKQLKRPEFGDRFKREAKVMQRLDDPAFVRFVDYFETRDVAATGAFLVMDFLPGMPGSSLRDAIRRAEGSPLPFRDVMEAFGRYARALSLMHRMRIYHRDIKPSNLYYPASELSRAAIMDLGIARDVSGTATTGQVPGTLDYMPPEVVIGGSRGDAGMDIYALGLCLYEAISGRTGYPRLPTGPQAFSAFYERARSRRPPVFDSPVVENRPLLHALLKDMTALDPKVRLQSAEVLKQRIAAAAKESPGDFSASAPTVDSGSFSTKASSSVDRPTGATSGGMKDGDHVSSYGVAPKRRPVGLIAFLAVVAILAISGIAFKDEINLLLSNRRKEEIEKPWKEELERRRKLAVEEAEKVLAAFGNDAVTASAADAEASKWMLKWRNDAAATGIFAGKTNEFSRARTERLARDAAAEAEKRLRAAKAEADRIIEACRGTNTATTICEEQIKVWQESWRGAISDSDFSGIDNELSLERAARNNRDAYEARIRIEEKRLREERLKAAAKAVAAAAVLEAGFADAKQTLDSVDAAYKKWRNESREVLDEPSVSSAEEKISAARRRRVSEEDGVRVVAECERHLDNILLVGAEHVKNWREHITQAEIALQRAEAKGRIGATQAQAVRSRIEACRKWTVGVIDNKTDRPVEFEGRTIGPVSTATIVFTNGYITGTSLTSVGCEPIHVKEEQFASRVFTVMPRDLEENVCETKAIVPDIPDGILCLVDGIKRKPGEILLRRGRHLVRYRRQEQTHPGVKDYEPKEYSFETLLSRTVEVPPPSGEWSFSADFKAAREKVESVAKARELVAEIRRLLQPLPVGTRRARLERAHALLADWKTPEILANFGAGTKNALRAEYDAERQRVRGNVRNDTPFTISVSTDGKAVDVPSGETKLITFERHWPADAHISVAGYEFVMLPRVSSEFDGTTFVVEQKCLVPLPVRMTVPVLEEGVICRVDGVEVEEKVELRPGQHEVVYSKPDFVSQKMSFTVRMATPAVLPVPAKMEPSGAFSGLASALKAFNSGAVDAAKQLTDSIGTIEDPARRQELEDLKRAIELRERLEGNRP